MGSETGRKVRKERLDEFFYHQSILYSNMKLSQFLLFSLDLENPLNDAIERIDAK